MKIDNQRDMKRITKKFHIHSSSACVYEFEFMSLCVSVCLCVRVSVPVFPHICACVFSQGRLVEEGAREGGGERRQSCTYIVNPL